MGTIPGKNPWENEGTDGLKICGKFDDWKNLGGFKASLELYSFQGNGHELWHHGKGSTNFDLHKVVPQGYSML